MAATEDRLTIAPLRSISVGRSARVSATSPSTLVAMTLVKGACSASWRSLIGGARPALLTSRSTPRKSAGKLVDDALQIIHVAHVGHDRQEALAELALERVEAVAAAAGADHPPALAGEASRARQRRSRPWRR